MPESPRAEPAEVVVVSPGEQPRPAPPSEESEPSTHVEEPAKVMRIGAMVRQLLEEVRHAGLDEPSRDRLRDIFESSVKELSEVLSPDLREELTRLSLPFDEGTPSEAELRIAHAQLVGWLEGLFHGIQAMLFAQQAESRARFEEMRRSLPAGEESPGGQGNYL